jgi:hypothetical protein
MQITDNKKPPLILTGGGCWLVLWVSQALPILRVGVGYQALTIYDYHSDLWQEKIATMHEHLLTLLYIQTTVIGVHHGNDHNTHPSFAR